MNVCVRTCIVCVSVLLVCLWKGDSIEEKEREKCVERAFTEKKRKGANFQHF